MSTETPPIPGQTPTIEAKKQSAFPHQGIPGQPHPDVAIAKTVLREIQPGDVLPYDQAAKALQMTASDPVFRRRFDTARKHLEQEGVSIACVPRAGFLRELANQTKERVSGRETRTVGRKARRNVRQLATIDVSQIPVGERPELFALMTINKAVQITTGKSARQKLIAASTAISAELAVTKALEVLQDRAQSNGDKQEQES